MEESGTLFFQKLPPEKREKIFEAAVSEFAGKGYRGASMNCLVKAAGISKGSIFQYFRTKRDLFDGIVAIAERRVKDYVKSVRDETANLSFFTRIEKLLWAGFHFIDAHPMLAKIYFRVLQSGEAPLGFDRIFTLRDQSHEFMVELVSEAVLKGELRLETDVNKTAFLVNHLLEVILRGYFTDFLAKELELYKASALQKQAWINELSVFLKSGLTGNLQAVFCPSGSETVREKR